MSLLRKLTSLVLGVLLILETLPSHAINKPTQRYLEGSAEKALDITQTIFDGSTQFTADTSKTSLAHALKPVLLAQSDAFGQYPSGDPRAIPKPKKPDKPRPPSPEKEQATNRDPDHSSPESLQSSLAREKAASSSSQSQEDKALKFLFWGFVATFGILASLGVGGIALSGTQQALALLASVIGGIGTLFNLEGAAIVIQEVIAPLILGPILGVIDSFIPGETPLNEASKELGLLSRITYWTLRVSLLLGSLAYFPLLGTGILSGLSLAASIPVGIASGGILFSNLLYPAGQKIKNSIREALEERRIKRQEEERQRKKKQGREADRKAKSFIQDLHQQIDQLNQLSQNKKLTREELHRRLQEKLKETRLKLRELPPSEFPNGQINNHYLNLHLPSSGNVPVDASLPGKSWGTLSFDEQGSLRVLPSDPKTSLAPVPADSLSGNGIVTSLEMELRPNTKDCPQTEPCFKLHDAIDQDTNTSLYVCAPEEGVILLTGQTSEKSNQIFMAHIPKDPDFDTITELEFSRGLHFGESTNPDTNGILVAPGEYVFKHEIIGLAGHTGPKGTRTHNHTDRFVIRKGEPGFEDVKKAVKVLAIGQPKDKNSEEYEEWRTAKEDFKSRLLRRVNLGPVKAQNRKAEESTRDVYVRRYGSAYQMQIKPNLSEDRQKEIDNQLGDKKKSDNNDEEKDR